MAASVKQVAAEAGLVPNHANWLEAFSFCRVAELPSGVKASTPSARLLNAEETRALYGDGVFGGGPYSAPDEVMEKIFNAALADVLEKLRFA